jgi:hypothetical protein
MALEVISFVTYVSRPPRSKADSDAISFVRAIKGQPVNLANTHTLDTTKAEQAVEWFGTMAALALEMEHLRGPILLVPMPSSRCCCETDGATRTLPLAVAIASRMKDVILFDALRWRQHYMAAHQGGVRNAQKLYNNLVLTAPVPPGTPVLVDDVFTTGAHTQAAAARLSTAANQCHRAICVARSVLTTQSESFGFFRRKITNLSLCACQVIGCESQTTLPGTVPANAARLRRNLRNAHSRRFA